jgi:pyruvate/2-oxoglutarate dehydrogenase complex dihydrolipoamide dehydrogenase (E3) component
VISTGQRNAPPSIPGLDRVSALDNVSVMELDRTPEHLAVIGAGYVGLEFAQMFRRFGSRVTVIGRGPVVLGREDADVAAALLTVLRDDGIDVRLDTETQGVEPLAGGGVRLTAHQREATWTLDASHLLLAAGRRPNTDDLDAEAGGVALDARGYVVVTPALETTAPGTYAIGDVKGGPAFTHIAYDDFRILERNLLHGGADTTTNRLVPYTVFTDPQLGRIGMTEEEARTAGRNVRIASMPMSHVARALEMDETRGFMKAVVDADSGQILGAAVLGVEGGELASVLQVAMMGRLPYTALRDGVFSHPTMAESLNNLFASLDP